MKASRRIRTESSRREWTGGRKRQESSSALCPSLSTYDYGFRHHVVGRLLRFKGDLVSCSPLHFDPQLFSVRVVKKLRTRSWCMGTYVVPPRAPLLMSPASRSPPDLTCLLLGNRCAASAKIWTNPSRGFSWHGPSLRIREQRDGDGCWPRRKIVPGRPTFRDSLPPGSSCSRLFAAFLLIVKEELFLFPYICHPVRSIVNHRILPIYPSSRLVARSRKLIQLHVSIEWISYRRRSAIELRKKNF